MLARGTSRNKMIYLTGLFFLLSLAQAADSHERGTLGRAPLEDHNAIAERFIARLKAAPVVLWDENGNPIQDRQIAVERKWKGDKCNSSVTNRTGKPVKLGNIILFSLPETGLDPDTPIYGEGFQMLSQTEGTLAAPVDVTVYSDRKHYRIPEPGGLRTVYNMIILHLKTGGYVLLGFTSSNRFAGRFSFDDKQLMISCDPEQKELQPGGSWKLEEFTALSGKNINELMVRFASAIQLNHPRIKWKGVPTGWCSWYCYGEKATAKDIDDNLSAFSEKAPYLKYIQIDDGYQPFMGDWLDENPQFGSMDSTIRRIKKFGFEPAIWVAPFIAEKDSRIFREHPGWFVKGEDGKPLNSGTKGFGGWRRAPWYALDGTQPEVQQHLRNVFREMREKWGITYFKLDANYWGAIDGRHADVGATRIEAYRRAMEAIIEGAGADAVVLGCNAPMWPSLGLVTVMRTSNDISRNWQTFKTTATENLSRSWQNNRLWINDPDCLLLTGNKEIPANEWLFHATAIHATGGMVISGDKAGELGNEAFDILRKSIPASGHAPVFTDDSLRQCYSELQDTTFYYCFNWTDTPTTAVIKLRQRAKLTEYWSGRPLGVHDHSFNLGKLEPRSATIIRATPL